MPRRNEAEEAFRATIGELATRTQKDTLAGGREVVQQSAPLWRRVTDGAPCGWCAMLASRGPVYSSAAKAGQGRRYHGHCGCTAEPFDGAWEEWEPTPDEQRYIDAYNATHESGMTGDETAAKMDAWLKDPANALAKNAAELTVDGLDEDAFDALVMRYMDEGDFDAVDRLSEMWDAKQAALAPKPWAPDASDPFNPQTFEWFEALNADGQADFLDQVPYSARNAFMEEQWSWANARTAPKRGSIPSEREIRAAWEDWLDLEWLRLEEATKGNALTRQAAADGRRIRDLYRGYNLTTVSAWASEETKWYWAKHGRMTYQAFRASMVGNSEVSRTGTFGVSF